MSTVNEEKKFSSMKEINSKLSSSMSNNKLNSLGIISVERSLIYKMVKKEKAHFQRKVVQNFVRQKNFFMVKTLVYSSFF